MSPRVRDGGELLGTTDSVLFSGSECHEHVHIGPGVAGYALGFCSGSPLS